MPFKSFEFMPKPAAVARAPGGLVDLTKNKKNGNIAAFMMVDHRGRRAAGRRPNKTNPNAGRKKVKQVDKVTRNLAAAASPASTPEAKKAKVKRSGATKDPKWAANMELVTTCYKSKLGDCYNRGMSQTTYLKAVEDKYNIKPSTLTPRSWLLPRTSSWVFHCSRCNFFGCAVLWSKKRGALLPVGGLLEPHISASCLFLPCRRLTLGS